MDQDPVVGEPIDLKQRLPISSVGWVVVEVVDLDDNRIPIASNLTHVL